MVEFRPFGPDLTQDEVTILANDNFNQVRMSLESLVPAGAVTMTAATKVPVGWLLCDGSAVSRTLYASLFASLGTTYGVGDGSTTFNLPNLKGRVPAGFDSSQTEFNTMGKTGGDKNLQAHTHSTPDHNHYGGASANDVNSSASQGYPAGNNHTSYRTSDRGVAYAVNAAAIWGGGSTTGSSGSGSGQNLQPYIVLKYIIKT